jgi:diaminopimelate epimerase
MIRPQLKLGGQVTVDMGVPRLLASEIPTTLCLDDQKVIAQSLEVAGESWSVTCVVWAIPTVLPSLRTWLRFI